MADKITYYSQRTWPKWLSPIGCEFEHTKSTPCYLSLPLILSVTHIYIYPIRKEIGETEPGTLSFCGLLWMAIDKLCRVHYRNTLFFYLQSRVPRYIVFQKRLTSCHVLKRNFRVSNPELGASQLHPQFHENSQCLSHRWSWHPGSWIPPLCAIVKTW